MQGYNVILLYDKDKKHLLMCKRRKNPYMGMLNLVGGKIEQDEDGLTAAYRELYEEANVCREDTALTHLMDFIYHLSDCYVEAYVGKLNRHVDVSGEENELLWVDVEQDFFNMKLFGGEGDIGHMVEQVKLHKDILHS